MADFIKAQLIIAIKYSYINCRQRNQKSTSAGMGILKLEVSPKGINFKQ